MTNPQKLLTLVHAVQEKRWIPDNLIPATYFSENDWWLYFKSYHPHMCSQCDFYGDIKQFNGTDIRGTFPYLEIIDENTIYPNVHPNCHCLILRLFKVEL